MPGASRTPDGKPPAVRLGATSRDGIAPTLFALLERASARQPTLAREMRGHVELRFAEEIDPVRIAFAGDEVTVEDGAWGAPDLVVSGRLPHVLRLATTPMLAGVPNPTTGDGRATLARLARRDVTIEGDRRLGRRLLRLLEL